MAYESSAQTLQTNLMVQLIDTQAAVVPVITVAVEDEEINTIIVNNTPYLQFASQFESWASANRTWFVIIAVSIIVLALIILSFIQSRLK
jgi:Cu/Ag efflux pump CusA